MMRSVSVVFRILLLPIFLVRFCLPRPPEAESGRSTTFGDGPHDVYSYLGQYKNETHFTELVQIENDETILNNVFEQSRYDVPSSKINFLEGYSTIEAVEKVVSGSLAKDFETFNTNKLRFLLTKSGLLNNLNDNQFTETLKEEDMETIPGSRRLFEKSLSENFTKNKSEKANTLDVEHLLQKQVSPLGQHSTTLDREREMARFRTKRDVDDGSGSMNFQQASFRTTPPEYMVHLFQLLSGTHYESLRNFVVTGFVNINMDKDSSMTSADETARRQKLVFDVNIPSETETIHYAELRLYFVHLGQPQKGDVSGELTGDQEPTYHIRISESNEFIDVENRLLAEKAVNNIYNSWVSFNLTSSVQSWTTVGPKVLEISTVLCGNCKDSKNNGSCKDCSGYYMNDLVVNLNQDEGKGPILVIFSRKSQTPAEVPHRRKERDTSNKNGHHNPLDENLQFNTNAKDFIKSSASLDDHYFQGLVEFISVSVGPSDSVHSSTFASLQDSVRPVNTVHQQNDTNKDNNKIQIKNNATFLNNKDNQPFNKSISSRYGSSQGIPTRTSTEARSSQKHLTFHNVKTSHAEDDSTKLSENIWRIRTQRDAKARHRRHSDGLFKHNTNSLLSRYKREIHSLSSRHKRETHSSVSRHKRETHNSVSRHKRETHNSVSRHKRETHNSVSRQKRSKKKRVSCQRNEMYVDFETIKWDKVIIFPRGYQAFECVGKCYTPISEYLTPTKHAIIQTLVHTSYPDQASRACCVPTKLEPISILYWDDNGDIKYDYTYEGMVVAECGCR